MMKMFYCRRAYITIILLGIGLALPSAVLAQADLPAVNLPNLPAPNLEVQAVPGHNRAVMASAYSRDGSLLATGGYDQTIRLWNVGTGAMLRSLAGHKAGVTGLIFSPDGGTLISVARTTYSTHADNRICLWDVKTGELKKAFEGAVTGSANAIALSADGKLLAGGGGSYDKKIRIWNLQSGELVATLQGHSGAVESLAFSRAGRLLASGAGGSDTSIRLWDTQTGQVKNMLKGHDPGGIISLDFSPDDLTLLSGSNDQTARLWSVAEGKPLRSFAHYDRGSGENVTRAVFSPDGNIVATVGRLGHVGAIFWETATGKRLGSLPGASYEVRFSPDGLTIAYGAGNSVHLWDVQKRQDIRVLRGSAPLHAMVLSHSGKTLATGDNEGTIRFWLTQEGRMHRMWEGHKARVTTLAFSSDDAWLLSGGEDGAVSLWSVETGECKWTRVAHGNGVQSVAFVGKRYVLSTGREFGVRILTRETGKAMPQVNGTDMTLTTQGPVGVMAISSPQGELEPLLAVGAGNQIVLYSADDLEVLHTLRGHSSRITGLAFSVDGRQLISISHDKTALLWDVVSGQMVRGLVTLDRPLNSVAMASNGLIAVAWDDLRVLKTDANETMHSLRESLFRNPMVPMPGTFHALSFSSNGKFLYTAGEDGAVHVWGVNRAGTIKPVAQMWPVSSEITPPDATPNYVTITAQGYYAAAPDGLGQLLRRHGNQRLSDDEVRALFSPEKVKEVLSGGSDL
jgi:WD40 repeat protein